MRNLKNSYAWYDLDEKIRREIYLKNETFQTEDCQYGVYLPVLWANSNINYRQPYGLLYFPKVFGGAYDKPNYKGKKWFGVRVSSPDDWDLDFDIDLPSLYPNEKADKQYNYLIQIVKDNVITGPADPEKLFLEVKRQFLSKYPNAITHGI
jgi:hypothetical protein